jgi:hypothetical protein
VSFQTQKNTRNKPLKKQKKITHKVGFEHESLVSIPAKHFNVDVHLGSIGLKVERHELEAQQPEGERTVVLGEHRRSSGVDAVEQIGIDTHHIVHLLERTPHLACGIHWEGKYKDESENILGKIPFFTTHTGINSSVRLLVPCLRQIVLTSHTFVEVFYVLSLF